MSLLALIIKSAEQAYRSALSSTFVGPTPPLTDLSETGSELSRAMVDLLRDGERCSMAVLSRDRSGLVNILSPIQEFNQLIVARVDELDRERYQHVLSDAPKIYGFGQDHVIYSVSATLLDTYLVEQISVGKFTWDGASIQAFSDFAMNYAMVYPAVAANNVVRFVYGRRIMYGAMLSFNVNQLGETPHMASTQFDFYVTSQVTV